jgi:hypothetical protein
MLRVFVGKLYQETRSNSQRRLEECLQEPAMVNGELACECELLFVVVDA